MPRKVIMFDVWEWNKLVSSTYGRTYNFQQQDGCRDRGIYSFSIPCTDIEDYSNDDIPEVINSKIRGVSFQAWLDRDPDTPDFVPEYKTALFWERNFYPNVTMIIKDLENKGILKEGDYIINIDW